jgi:hypothetical protein
MLDETRTICGLNGRNSDLVRNDSFVTPLKIRACGQRISSTSGLGRYFVRKNDGVPFEKSAMFNICQMIV